MKDKLYAFFINKKPYIREEYVKRRETAQGLKKYFLFLYILFLNIVYPLFFKKREFFFSGKVCKEKSESSVSIKKSPEDTVKDLLKYDVISFDVFDTLLFRCVSEPSDVFAVTGIKLLYPNFKNIRVRCEKKARQIKYKKTSCYEVTLNEIWEEVSNETGIDKEKGIKAEIESEKILCRGNPYMKKIIRELKKNKKRIIAVTDTYLSKETVRELLKTAGITEINEIYCSCEYEKSKAEGRLYSLVKEREGKNLSFVHIGDNKISDIKNVRKHGIKTVFYKNVNSTGNIFRTNDMSSFTGSVYRGTVNSHIHSGFKEYSPEYEYGFIYGGLFAVGYCKFIKNFISVNNIQKILFLSRDGAVLKKLYEKMYPEEKEKTEYVYWSRLGALKISCEYFKEDYFNRMLFHKASGKYTLKDVLDTMELPFPPQKIANAVKEKEESIFTLEIGEKVKNFLTENWETVLEGYREQREAGRLYFQKILNNCSSAAAVDIGWAGSGAVMLDTAVNKIWNLNCPITGIIGGAVSFNSPDNDNWDCFFQRGKLISYMFSQRENRDLWLFHNPSLGHNLYFEALLGDVSGSFKGFYLNDMGQLRLRFKENHIRPGKIKEVHKGVFDFAEKFLSLEKQLGFEIQISGRDAYAPMAVICKNKSKQIQKRLEELTDNENL